MYSVGNIKVAHSKGSVYNLSKYLLLRSCPSNIFTVPNNRDWQVDLNSKLIYWESIWVSHIIKKIVYWLSQAGEDTHPTPLSVSISVYSAAISPAQLELPLKLVVAAAVGLGLSLSLFLWVISFSFKIHLIGRVIKVGQVPGTKKAGETSFQFLYLDAGTASPCNLCLEKFSKHRKMFEWLETSKYKLRHLSTVRLS